jgi:hypothetical protein
VLVFGDRVVRADPRTRLRSLADLPAALAGERSDAERHDALVAALIEAGELAQGLIDAEFHAAGRDALTPLHAAALDLTVQLARDVTASWRSGSARLGVHLDEAVASLLALPLPDEIACRTAEGFAFYAVYPEAYVEAVASRGWSGRPLLIGVRSIGLALAAAAAAERGCRIISLRPTGDPFRREVRAAPDLRRLIRAHEGPVAIADEGPGLSGSSFGAVGDLLAELGVAEDRTVYLPSHHGEPGSRAAPGQLARWRRAQRLPATLELVLARRPIANWFTDLIGPVLQTEDISGGAWRHDLAPQAWPPAWRWQERRKFRLTTGGGRFVARFAGLGEIGRRKLRRARALAKAGFAPEPLALRSGFLLEPWIEGAPSTGMPEPRDVFVERIGHYLGFRARRFPAPAEPGATDEELLHMAQVNAGQLGGDELRAAVTSRWAGLQQAPRARRVAIDGRLHAWEWRRDARGRIWKTDALDHCEAHDLVGCQDVAWDVAGATVEFSLDRTESERLRRMVGATAEHEVHPAALERSLLAYCALQAGLWSYAAEDVEEADRAGTRVGFYAAKLRQLAHDGWLA